MSEPGVPTGAKVATGVSIGIIIAVILGCGGLMGCGLVAGVLMVGVNKSREAAKRIECTNNLKILGIAFHTYHDTNNNFPSEVGTNPSFYVPLLTFVEQDGTAAALPTNPAAGNTPIKVFLCPNRRTPAVGGKRDYGYAATQSNALSVLDAPAQPPLTLATIINQNGSSNTLVLAHVWMNPATYNGGDPTDLGWATKNNARSVRNAAFADNDPNGSTSHLGSPHANVMPCLFADGHAQTVPYTFANWAQAWSYNNKQPFPLP